MGSLASLLFSPSSRSRSRAASCPGSGKSSCLGRAFWGFPSHPCPELPGSAAGTLPRFPRCPPRAQAPRQAPSPLSLDIWSPSDSIFQKKIKNPQTQKRNGKRTFPWKFGVKKKALGWGRAALGCAGCSAGAPPGVRRAPRASLRDDTCEKPPCWERGRYCSDFLGAFWFFRARRF